MPVTFRSKIGRGLEVEITAESAEAAATSFEETVKFLAARQAPPASVRLPKIQVSAQIEQLKQRLTASAHPKSPIILKNLAVQLPPKADPKG